MIGQYNWCRVHETLSVTPAMEFGLAGHIWSVAELMQEAEALDLAPLPRPPSFPRSRRPFQVVRGGKIG